MPGQPDLAVLLKLLKQFVVLRHDLAGDLVGDGFVVRTCRLIAAFDHFQPSPSAINPCLNAVRMASREPRDGRVSLVEEVVLHQVPSQFKNKLKRLNQPLPFQFAQWS